MDNAIMIFNELFRYTATAVVNTVYSGVQGAAQGLGSAVQTGYNAVTNAAATGINGVANTVNRLTG